MRIVGMFKTKTHLPELIKEVESGEELCITNRGKKVAFIIPVRKYYAQKSNDLFKKLNNFVIKKDYILYSQKINDFLKSCK